MIHILRIFELVSLLLEWDKNENCLLIYRFTDLDPIKCKGDASGHILYNKINFHLRSLVDLYGARIGATFFFSLIRKKKY